MTCSQLRASHILSGPPATTSPSFGASAVGSASSSARAHPREAAGLASSQPDKAVWGPGQRSFQAKLERPRKSTLDPRIHVSGRGEPRSLTMVILIIPGSSGSEGQVGLPCSPGSKAATVDSQTVRGDRRATWARPLG